MGRNRAKNDGSTYLHKSLVMNKPTFTAGEVAERVQGKVLGDASTLLCGIGTAENAEVDDLTFADTQTHFEAAEKSRAAAVLISGDLTSGTKVLIRVADARIAVAHLLPIFFPAQPFVAGIDPTARIAASAQVDPTAHVGPCCVIDEEVQIGARSVLMGGNHLAYRTVLGEDVCLFPNVVLYARTCVGNRVKIHAGTVIGSDGYGYVFDQGQHRKVLQVGNVMIHDDVEIGANTCIDRAALGSTVIGAGTKIDNLVHVAHNVVMGKHCLIMGQVGFAGSTQLEDYVVIASQSGIAGHLKLGSQATVGAKSGVMRDVPAGGTVWGIPAAPDKQAKRQIIAVQQLPKLMRRMKTLENQIAKLVVKEVH